MQFIRPGFPQRTHNNNCIVLGAPLKLPAKAIFKEIAVRAIFAAGLSAIPFLQSHKNPSLTKRVPLQSLAHARRIGYHLTLLFLHVVNYPLTSTCNSATHRSRERDAFPSVFGVQCFSFFNFPSLNFPLSPFTPSPLCPQTPLPHYQKFEECTSPCSEIHQPIC